MISWILVPATALTIEILYVVIVSIISFFVRLLAGMRAGFVSFTFWFLLRYHRALLDILCNELQYWKHSLNHSLKLREIQKYAIDVREAKASSKDDLKRIMDVIGNRVDEVNNMITKLVERG